MRVLIATTIVASLFATSLFAAEVSSPLAPGAAAGVKKAQMTDLDYTILYVAAGGALIGVLASSAANGSHNSVVNSIPATS